MAGEMGNTKLLVLLLFGTGIFNIVDYFVTLHVVGLGFKEANPAMAALLHTPYFPMVKLVLIPLLLTFVWFSRKYVGDRLFCYAWLVFASYSSLMLYFVWLFRQGF